MVILERMINIKYSLILGVDFLSGFGSRSLMEIWGFFKYFRCGSYDFL